MGRPFFVAFLSIIVLHSSAQEINYSSADIRHQLQRLNTAATVLYVAAHPDDENTRLISYLVNEKHFRTAYLSLTRGEGGQNLIGGEQGAPLGVIRTQELHAARSVDGAEQYFTSAADFGYSKSPGETLEKWDRDTILKEMVLVIRKLKPDVIICRFPTTGEGGHGHHTASAILAVEAFDAAADKNKFREQLDKYEPWQCRRIYWNTFNFSSTNTIGPGQFTIDVGGYNSILGKSYGEIASESRSMHKSQGFGTIAQRGFATENFRLLRGDSVSPDPFAGIPSGLARFPELKKTSSLIGKCIRTFDAAAPEKTIPQLAAIRKQLLSIKPNDGFTRQWIQIKVKDCERLMAACSGLWLDAAASASTAIPGSVMQVKITVLNRSAEPIELKTLGIAGKILSDAGQLAANKSFTANVEWTVPGSAEPSAPFWHNNNSTTLSKFIQSPSSGHLANPPAIEARFVVSIAGEDIEFIRGVVYRKGDPVKGEVSHPLYVVPAVEINFEEPVYMLEAGKTKTIRVTVKSNADSTNCVVRIGIPPGLRTQPFDSVCFLAAAGDKKTMEIGLHGDAGGPASVTAAAVIDGKIHNASSKWIEYDHIPKQVMYSEASAKLISGDIRRGVKKVLYIPGAGDEVARCLSQAGYDVTIADAEKITPEMLMHFDAVVTGIRAFNTNEKLHEKMPMLLRYVGDGGNLIVQYNTNSRVGPLAFTPGPFPYSITRQRVTDENAAVEFLAPEHPALNQPNKITAKDFEGWVQERGIYFGESKDARYRKILSMKDPGESELDGSLLIARHGRGNFVYTGLAFFRQLPAGVPGAYRLLANLLALPADR